MALALPIYPVVYAVRVEPSWFGDGWEDYLRNWQDLGSGGTELRCRGLEISRDRLVGRADYPHGTDESFSPTHVTTWLEVEGMAGKPLRSQGGSRLLALNSEQCVST
jgi:hypothetical protein